MSAYVECADCLTKYAHITRAECPVCDARNDLFNIRQELKDYREALEYSVEYLNRNSADHVKLQHSKVLAKYPREKK